MEIFDLYDKHGNKLNKQMARGSKTSEGEYHRVVHIWIQHTNGEYLIQQRNKSTDRNPYQWAPTAGAVQALEDSKESALRETQEEIGILLEPNDFVYKDSLFIDNEDSNYIIDMYLVKKDIPLSQVTIDKTEVKAVQYASKEKIYKMIENKTFWNFFALQPEIDYFHILEKS